MKKFRDWLIERDAVQHEVSTDTSDCARFAQRLPIGTVQQRMYPDLITMKVNGELDDDHKKKRR